MERERLERTKQLLIENRAVRVDELVSMFDVSPMTIRRDLDKLAAENNHIRRCRGGAIFVTDITFEETYPKKQILNLDGKQEIAQRAFNLLKSGQLLYLDAGTTCHEVAKLLVLHPLRIDVVTNDMHTALLLGENGYRVYSTGGTVEQETGCMIGDFAENTVKMFCFDIAFMGATSIDENFEVSTPTQEKAFLKRLVLSRSKHSYMLADQTKFFHRSHYYMYTLKEFDGVFTNKEFIEKNIEILQQLEIALL